MRRAQLAPTLPAPTTVTFFRINSRIFKVRHVIRHSQDEGRKETLMGLYFEDFSVGHKTVSRTRTITEADIVNFAGLSGDFVELHMSETFAASGPFGRRIAHGLL